MNSFIVLTLFSSISFLIYGLLCIFHNHMVEEFKRYKMEKFRKLTGYLEVLGGSGLLIGLYFSPIYFLSSAGLFLLMLLGVVTRIRVRDPFLEMIPAILLLIINLYLLFSAYLNEIN